MRFVSLRKLQRRLLAHSKRGILTPNNDEVKEINLNLLQQNPGQFYPYKSTDTFPNILRLFTIQLSFSNLLRCSSEKSPLMELVY